MKIGLISQEYPPETARGGIGTQTWNKARALARRGHEIHVLTASGKPGNPLRTSVEDGVNVHRMPTPDEYAAVNDNAAYWLGYSWLTLQQLRQLEQKHKFDLLDFAEYGGEGFAYLMDRTAWNWTPVVVQLHGPLAMFAERIGWPEKDSDFFKLGRLMEEVMIHRADGLMACSKNIGDFTSSYYSVPRSRIADVHCGVDSEAFSPSNGDSPPSPPTVLFVGNLAANKGVNTVAEAVFRLHPEFPSLRLQLLGKGDDDLIRNLRERARAVGAESMLDVVGFVGREDLPGYYRNATVFCSPAQHEPGVANVYIESMACGCPVIAANTGGAPEAVLDGETGLIIPPGDVEALTRSLRIMLNQPDTRRRMSRAARQRVEKYFAMDRYLERVLSVYEKAIACSAEKLVRLSGGAS